MTSSRPVSSEPRQAVVCIVLVLVGLWIILWLTRTNKNVHKRSRKELSIEKKIEIINRLEKGKSGSSLAKVYDVGTTLFLILKAEKKAFEILF